MTVLVSWIIGTIAMVTIALLPADARQHMDDLYFSIQLFETDQLGETRARASSKIEIHRENGDTVTCDDMSDKEGVIKCKMECDPDYELNKMFSIKFAKHTSYRTPPHQVITLYYGCVLEPTELEATYVHWQYAFQRDQLQYKKLTADFGLLRELVASSGPHMVKDYSFSWGLPGNLDASDIRSIYDFGQNSLSLSESYFQLGYQKEAENFKRQVISAAQSLLIPYRTVLGEHQSHAVTGDLEDYKRSLATLGQLFDNFDKNWNPTGLHELQDRNPLPLFQALRPVQRKRMWDRLNSAQNPLDSEQLWILYNNSSGLLGVAEFQSTYPSANLDPK